MVKNPPVNARDERVGDKSGQTQTDRHTDTHTNHLTCSCCLIAKSCLSLFATQWTVAHEGPMS